MRLIRLLLLPGILSWALLVGAQASEPSILKVLPHLLDEKGQISKSPGLFERDAYQKELRAHPSRITGVRYDVQWRAGEHEESNLKIRLYLRSANGGPSQPIIIEAPVQNRRRIGGWSSVVLDSKQYHDGGEILAWRAVLLDGETEIAEQKSFLW